MHYSGLNSRLQAHGSEYIHLGTSGYLDPGKKWSTCIIICEFPYGLVVNLPQVVTRLGGGNGKIGGKHFSKAVLFVCLFFSGKTGKKWSVEYILS